MARKKPTTLEEALNRALIDNIGDVVEDSIREGYLNDTIFELVDEVIRDILYSKKVKDLLEKRLLTALDTIDDADMKKAVVNRMLS